VDPSPYPFQVIGDLTASKKQGFFGDPRLVAATAVELRQRDNSPKLRKRAESHGQTPSKMEYPKRESPKRFEGKTEPKRVEADEPSTPLSHSAPRPKLRSPSRGDSIPSAQLAAQSSMPILRRNSSKKNKTADEDPARGGSSRHRHITFLRRSNSDSFSSAREVDGIQIQELVLKKNARDRIQELRRYQLTSLQSDFLNRLEKLISERANETPTEEKLQVIFFFSEITFQQFLNKFNENWLRAF
jgi:hypothetical protein